jgi:hypothetical protein
MNQLTKFTLLSLLLTGSLLVSSCAAIASLQPTPAGDTAQPTGISPTSQAPEAATQGDLPLPALATPYADSPAAGICAEAPGEAVISVEIFPDIPSPRCLKVTADQKLQVINRTDSALQLSLGRLEQKLQPQAETVLDAPFGDYLAPGVHILRAEPFSGPEILLAE